LTEISFAAKRHWKYPENDFALWKDELTLTEDYIRQNIVYKAQLGSLTLGFQSIVENKSDFYSGNPFIKKDFMARSEQISFMTPNRRFRADQYRSTIWKYQTTSANPEYFNER